MCELLEELLYGLTIFVPVSSICDPVGNIHFYDLDFRIISYRNKGLLWNSFRYMKSRFIILNFGKIFQLITLHFTLHGLSAYSIFPLTETKLEHADVDL